MEPQLAFGGWMPMPRKLKPASSVTAPPMLAVTATTSGPIALGMTCRSMIWNSLPPSARAAST